MKMTHIHAYLTFHGNCREAMTFYQSCLGGELTFQTVGESPLSVKMPKPMKEYIVHATLRKETLVLQGSDMVPPSGLVKGNAVSLCLECGSEDEIKKVYTQLSTEGKADHPLEYTFWGALFGGLTDRYGNHWLLNYGKK